MGEKMKFDPESGNESLPNPGEHPERPARLKENQAENSRNLHKENLEQILGKIETTAKTAQEAGHRHTEAKASEKPNPRFIGKQLKENSLKGSLRRVQKDLKPYQRPFSKLIHNRAVEYISEAGAKTVGRPSGLLAGGVAFFSVSVVVLFVSRYYGYEYNFFIGLISFPIGFLVGLAGEFIIRPVLRR